jgi:AcrR family transcriptional regulator
MNKQKRAYHHGNLPDTLVAAGLALVEAAGVEALSLRKLAVHIRVSAAAVYRHFADKDALLAAIAAEGFAMLNDKFDAAARTPEADNPLSRLQALGSAYVNLALDHPGLFRLMFGSRQKPGVRDARLDEQARRAYRTLEATVASCFGSSANNARVAATTVAAWSMVHGYAMLRLENQLAGFPPDSLPDTPAILASLIPQA